MRSNRLEDLYLPLRDLVPSLLEHAQAQLDDADLGRWRIFAFETSRSEGAQAEAVARGASHATGSKAPHTFRRKDGSPCSMAVDLLIVDARTGVPAPDGCGVWGVIPVAVHVVGRGRLTSGAFFRTIPGGDWMHVEWKGWEQLTKEGVVL